MQSATFDERFDPAKFLLVEAADGSTSGLYNNGFGFQEVGKVLLLSGSSASAKFLGSAVIEDNCSKSTLSVIWNDATTGASYRAYTGAYENQALGSAAQVYGSSVSRGSSSCSPLYLARSSISVAQLVTV